VIRILFVGDVMARVGRRLLTAHLEPLIDREQVDFVVANLENAAGGFGITPQVMTELDALPVDVWTSGNHIWDKKEGIPLLDAYPTLIRPANYPRGNPGRGWVVEETAAGVPVAVVNLQGQALMPPIDNAFRVADRVLEEIAAAHPELRVILVDMHAEATSEKIAMGRMLDGRVTAVLGTHTHVQTADERLLPGGTAYITDVGMTGPKESVIGTDPEIVIGRFLSQMPARFETAKGDWQLDAVLLDIEDDTGRPRSIERLREFRGR